MSMPRCLRTAALAVLFASPASFAHAADVVFEPILGERPIGVTGYTIYDSIRNRIARDIDLFDPNAPTHQIGTRGDCTV